MPTVNLIPPEGGPAVPVDEADVDYYVTNEHYRLETPGEGFHATAETERLRSYQGTGGAVVAAGTGALRAVTGGLSDVAADVVGLGDDFANFREAHPTASTLGEVGGYLLPTGYGGLVGKAGKAIGETAEGAGALAKIGRGLASGAVEGGLTGVQQGISDLALSDKPVSVERAASVLSSNILFGGAVGGVAGGLGKATEVGLARGKAMLERATARGVKAEGIAADLATLDAKGLRGAKQAELDAIEAARVPERAGIADDIAAHRAQMGKDKVFLASKGAEDAEVRSLAARSRKADVQLRNMLDNPKALATKPERAMAALQQQESALEGIIAKDAEIRATFAADTSGERLAALEAAPAALERNRALQKRIAGITAAPASERLAQIADATDLLAAGGPKESLAQKMLGGTLFGIGAGAVSQTGLPGAQYLAPIAGAGLAGIISKRMAGKFGAALTEAEARGAKALSTLLDVAKKVTPTAPILATKVLNAVRYAPETDEKPAKGPGKLAGVYKQRSDEIRSQVATGPDGKLAVTPHARQRIAKQLSPVAVGDPLLADQMETIAARRLAYLANALPKEPDLAGMQMGPSRWRPSDMDMRSFARKAAAVEDPHGVFERAAAGTVSPEDAEALREVYPELLGDFKRQLVERLPELRKSLPFQRRLALSILTGIPVDPALDPRILRVLQASYVNEDGSEGGMQAPKANPAFGSVRSQEKATPAQERAG